MAANKTNCLLLVFFLLSTLAFTTQATQEDSSNEINFAGIVSALAENGYKVMSSTLNNSLTSLVFNHNSATFTIFCPADSAIASLRNVQPPPTFLAYDITPYYLQRDDLELRSETLHMYSGIDALFPWNSLMVTSQVPHFNSDSDFEAELNLVKIIDWNIYNDGNIIVHGIQDFFNPSAEAILFPRLEHHEITIKSQEKGYFGIALNPLGFIVIFVR